MNSLDHPQDNWEAQANSIRQRLEADAWNNHHAFARDFSERQAHARRPENRRRLSWQDRALLILWIFFTLLLILRISTAEAQQSASVESAADQWGMEFIGDGRRLRSVALDTDIEAEVTGMVARVEVRQRFRNVGQGWAEAVYRFPLPEGAAVDRLLVHAGQRVLQGVIQEKQTAQRQYQQARAEGMVAALVEQQRPNQFETRLANIAAGEEISVVISFLAQVDYRDGAFSLQIPLTFTPRWEPAAAMTEWSMAPAPTIREADPVDDHYLTISIRLRSAVALASLESLYHDMDIHPALGGYDLYLADPDTRTDRVFSLEWKPEFGLAPQASLLTWDGGDAVYAMLMMSPPLAEALAPQPREVVFVIDTSGSMEGLSLQQARAALYQGLDHLQEDDRFNLVEFNSDSHLLFDQSVPADGAALVEAMDFIDGLSANGGTNMAPALHDAMSLPGQAGLLRQIVFITDGSVGNEEDLLLQIADELDQSRLFTVAIGSAPNTAFMRKASSIGRGNFTHIGRLDEVAERMTALWGRIESPALQDICVDWGMDAEYYPEIIPDLYAGEPLWLYARLPAQPRDVTLCGLLDGQPWEQLSRPVPGESSDMLATLWARSKIEALQDARMFGQDAELTRLQVIELALRFGLITPYTSMVAVDRTPVRPVAARLQGDEIANLLPAGSSATAVGFSPTASGWLAQLLLSLFTLLAVTGLLWFCTPPRRKQAGGPPKPPIPAPSRAG